MNTLHIINKTYEHTDVWAPCLAALKAGDALLLIENATGLAVDLGSNETPFHSIPKLTIPKGVQVYFLHADLLARGMEQWVPIEQHVSDAQFVELCIQYDNNISWF